MALTEAQKIAYLEELLQVGRKHGLSLSHEDGHGAFIIEKWDELNVAWLKAAVDKTES